MPWLMALDAEGETMLRLAVIDAAIDRSGLLGRKCNRRRDRCRCGHHSGVHVINNRARALPKDWIYGRCQGNFGRCECRKFVPYDYKKETDAKRNQLRKLVFDAMRMIDNG